MERDLSVVVPVYNEEILIEENLLKILSVFDESKISCELIIVDDGSTDKSYRIIDEICKQKKNAKIIRHKRRRGYSEAIRTGLCNAKGKYAGYLDADLQYDPEDIIKFYECAKQLQLNLVVGKHSKTSYSPFRKILSKSRNFLTCHLFKIPREVDANSIKIIKASLLQKIKFSKRKEVVGIEIILGAQRLGYNIFPLPVKLRKRLKGKSHFTFKLIFEGFISMISLYISLLGAKKKNRKICLSFDVEEFNIPQQNNVEHPSNRNTKFSESGLRKINDLFAKKKILGTFFFTGYYAKRESESVKTTQKQGHEIGCHSYQEIHHSKLNSEQIKKQISLATEILTKLCGEKPKGFRTPQFSVNKHVRDRLIEEGYLYDSSSHPAFVPTKYLNFQDSLYPSLYKNEKFLAILPVSVIPMIRFPISWWWMRNLGVWLTILGAEINLKMGRDVVLYFHPWEFVKLPKIKGVPSSINKNTGDKSLGMMEKFITHFQRKGYEFTTLSSIVK